MFEIGFENKSECYIEVHMAPFDALRVVHKVGLLGRRIHINLGKLPRTWSAMLLHMCMANSAYLHHSASVVSLASLSVPKGALFSLVPLSSRDMNMEPVNSFALQSADQAFLYRSRCAVSL